MKRILSTLILCAVAIGFIQAQRFQSGELYYNITDAEAKTVEVTYSSQDNTNYANLTESASIPSEVIYEGDSYSVTSIGSLAFANCQSLTNLTIPKSIDKIHILAFSGAEALQSILVGAMEPPVWDGYIIGNIPYTFTINVIPNAWDNYINDNYWKKLNLKVAKFKSGELYYNVTDTEPKAVEVTYDKVFSSGQNYKDITPNVIIPETVLWGKEEYRVTSIGTNAFRYNRTLVNITIPKSIDSIGTQAFDACYTLQSIQVAEDNTNYCSQNGVLFDAAKATLILLPPEHADTAYTVPETVTEIKTSAFSYSKVKDIKMPDGIKSIGFGAFYHCEQLENINLPEELTRIEYDLFNGCNRLRKITIPNGVTKIEHGAFYDCGRLTEINLPAGLITIEDQAFARCSSLQNIRLPEALDSIGASAFTLCSLKQINLPERLTVIGESAFSNNSIQEITIPNQVESIGTGAWQSCQNLTDIRVAEGNSHYSSEDGVLFNKDKTVLMQYPAGKQVIEYTVPQSVNTIDSYSFYSCQLHKITLSNGIKNIRYNVFVGCEQLSELQIWTQTPPAIESSTFEDYLSNKLIIYVNGDILNSYQEHYLWSSMNVQTKNFETNQICYYLIDGNQKTAKVTSKKSDNINYGTLSAVVTIPSEVTYENETYKIIGIGEGAFSDCTTLQEITLPDNMTDIGKKAFYHCAALKNVTIGNGTETIEESAFNGCIALEDITIPESLRKIGKEAFSQCIALEKTDFPEGIETLSESAFNDCTALIEITLPSSIKTWGEFVFSGCTKLQRIVLTEGISTIGYGAFTNCNALTKIDLPSSLSLIESMAFDGCENIKEITVRATTPPVLKRNAFTNASKKTTLYVPVEAIEAYRSANVWMEFNLQTLDTKIQTTTLPESLFIENGQLYNPKGLHLNICDFQGRIVFNGTKTTINLPEGIYIVHYKEKSYKVSF